MKSLLLFCFVACVHAYLPNVLNDGWEDYGSYDGTHNIGNVSNVYHPLSNDDLRASKRGAQFLHDVKRFFKTGFYTLPPLDPYYREHMPPLDIADNKNLRLHATLSNFNVTGLVAFTSDLLEIRYGNGRVDYRVNVPQLSVSSLADIQLLAGRIFQLKANGLLRVLLSDVVVRGALQVVQVPRHGSKVYQLQGQHTRLHVGDVKAHFLPPVKGPVLGSSTQGYDSDIWDDCLRVVIEKVNEYVGNLVFNQANQILDGPTVEQINAFLLGSAPTL